MRLYDPPEVRFLRSPEGVATMAAVSVAALVGVIAWARRGGKRERLQRTAIVASAVGAVALDAGLTELGRSRGWFNGAYFTMPTPVRWAFEGPLALAFYTAWMAGYRALDLQARHPQRTFALATAAFVPVAMAGAKWEMERGYFGVGNGYKLGYNALLTPAMLASPVLIYEGLRELLATPYAPTTPVSPRRHVHGERAREPATV
jgi:hypothetical protein